MYENYNATKFKRAFVFAFQSRAQTLMKAIQESVDQTEQSRMEFATLEQLREQEVGAIVRRTEVCPYFL